MRVCHSPEADLGGSGKSTTKGGELCMPTYLVQVSIPTIYIIDAKSPYQAMDKAATRFRTEHNTNLSLELQWPKLKGSAHETEWIIADWGELPQ
jgi:hypothetical protein